ncbi:O-antigen ligase family protein [Salinisphaera sp. RV14]|uniref:O-antigen ligase family protein n=1 Tax=unclassified Salinisphaera TaxID=2649847 RepID=UPI003F87AA61
MSWFRNHPDAAVSGKSVLPPAPAETLGQRVPEMVGVFGLYLLAFFQIANKTTALVGLLLMLLAAIAGWRRFRATLAGSDVAWATLVLSFYVVLRAVVGAWQQPAMADANYHSLTDWMLLPLFPLVALYSRGDSRRIRRVLAVAMVGSLLGMALRSNWPAIAQAWLDSGRAHWGLPFLSSALYLGTLLIGWLAFAGRVMWPGRYRWPRTIAWLALASIMGEMLFLTQSRAVLLSLVIILPGMGLIKLWRTADPAQRRRGLGMAVAILIGVVALAMANRGPIVARFHKTSETVRAISSLKINKVPKTSLGQRVRIYRFGSRIWLEHPVWGWGPGFEATTMRPDAPRTPDAAHRYYDHLHDGYLETLVRFGVVGFGLAGLLAFFLIRGLWRAWRRGDVPLDIGLFLISSGLLAALTNVTDFRLTHKPYAFYSILLMGLMYGYTLKSLKPQHAPPPDRSHTATAPD